MDGERRAVPPLARLAEEGARVVYQRGSASAAFRQRVFPHLFIVDGEARVVASGVPRDAGEVKGALQEIDSADDARPRPSAGPRPDLRTT